MTYNELSRAIDELVKNGYIEQTAPIWDIDIQTITKKVNDSLYREE